MVSAPEFEFCAAVSPEPEEAGFAASEPPLDFPHPEATNIHISAAAAANIPLVFLFI